MPTTATKWASCDTVGSYIILNLENYTQERHVIISIAISHNFLGGKIWHNSTHVVIIAVVTRVAWNVNKFCVYALSIPLFMLSNIADTVNKHTMTMAGKNEIFFYFFRFITSIKCNFLIFSLFYFEILGPSSIATSRTKIDNMRSCQTGVCILCTMVSRQ